MRVLLILLAGCTPARRWEPGRDVVRHIRFEGNTGPIGGDTDYALRNALEQEGTPFGLTVWPLSTLVRPHPLELPAAERDAERVLTWYRHHGWFDARFEGWDRRQVRRATARKAGVVDVVGRVVPGPQCEVRSLVVEGLPIELQAIGGAVIRGGPVAEGDAFSMELAELARAELEGRLDDAGRAFASVELQVDAWPEDGAVDLILRVEPGPSARVGPVEVLGAERVPEAAIRGALGMEEGDRWRGSEVEEARGRMLGMGTFSIAEVVEDRGQPESAVVPVTVNVTEGRFKRLRLGVGGEFDGVQVTPRLSAGFRHNNVGRQVVAFEVDTSVGLAAAFSEDGVQGLAPTYSVEGRVGYDRLFHRDLRLELVGGVTQDVATGLFAYRQPAVDLRAAYQAHKRVQLRLGPHYEQYRYLVDTPEQRSAARRSFGRDFQNPYQLFALDQGLDWDRRDHPIHPTRGTLFTLDLREALPLAPVDPAFVGVRVEGRGFVPLRGRRTFPFVLALGGTAHVIEAFGERGVPWPEQVFLGGATSIRGFRGDQVGPYDLLCAEDPFALPGESGIQTYALPHGGTFGVEATAEFRATFWEGFRGAIFTDAGLLAPRWQGVQADLFRASAGVGLRYDTLVGPVRFDVSGRPLYPEDFGPVDVIDCAVGEDRPRVSDLLSTFDAWRGTEAHPPVALVFFLAIGEAL